MISMVTPPVSYSIRIWPPGPLSQPCHVVHPEHTAVLYPPNKVSQTTWPQNHPKPPMHECMNLVSLHPTKRWDIHTEVKDLQTNDPRVCFMPKHQYLFLLLVDPSSPSAGSTFLGGSKLRHLKQTFLLFYICNWWMLQHHLDIFDWKGQ